MSDDKKQDGPEFETFSNDLVERLAKKIDLEIIRHDVGRIEFGGAKVNLTAWFEVYQNSPPELQSDALERIVEILVNCLEEPETLTFEEARPRLRPKIWSRWMFASMALQAHVTKDGGPPQMPTRLLGEHLILSFVLDSEDTMASLDWSSFCSWGYSFDDVLKIAIENADEATVLMGSPAKDGQSGHCMMAAQDSYDSVRFLSEGAFAQFEIGLPRWAFSASRDNCVVCSAENEDHINMMLRMAFETSVDDPKPLPPFPLVDRGNGWTSWQPSTDQKSDDQLAQRQREFLLEIYSDQRSLLRLSSSARKDFSYVEVLAGDSQSTSTTWQPGTECLLPEADYVVFQGDEEIKIPWDQVVETCPELMAPAEAIYPTRWRTYGYPSEQQIARMQSDS